jgi:TniQ protein
MQRVSIDDPAWRTTFPHLVAPLPDEWLPGLLLRCDEVNHWSSMTTLALLQQLSPREEDRYKRVDRYMYIDKCLIDLDYLTKLLAITTNASIATTYYFERVQLSNMVIFPERIMSPFLFRLCPKCVAELRLLRRTLILPHITHCPQHQLALHHMCQCGSSLHLFHPHSLPFTCYTCGMDWANLPRIEASSERVTFEREILLWYGFFFSKSIGSPESITFQSNSYGKAPSERKVNLLKQETEIVSYFCYELYYLDYLVSSLVERDLSPFDVVL